MKSGFFVKELLLFAITLGLGIFASVANISLIDGEFREAVTFNLVDLLILLAFFLIFYFIVTRFRRASGVFLNVILIIIVFSGTQVVLESFFRTIIAFGLTLLVVVLFAVFRNVITHNLGMVFGIAGIGSVFGTSVTPGTAIAIMAVLSFYDIIAVYWTGHMVKIAEGMIKTGAVFGFVVPYSFSDFFLHKDKAREEVGRRIMILGSGDVGLPVIMVSSLAILSLPQAIITGIFAAIGLLATHMIFVSQKRKRAMAALPPIATMTIIGYLISILVF